MITATDMPVLKDVGPNIPLLSKRQGRIGSPSLTEKKNRLVFYPILKDTFNSEGLQSYLIRFLETHTMASDGPAEIWSSPSTAASRRKLKKDIGKYDKNPCSIVSIHMVN